MLAIVSSAVDSNDHDDRYVFTFVTGQALASVSGFPDLSSLRKTASLLYGWEVRYEQTVLFPDVSFTCPEGRITNLTFVARPGSGSNQDRDPQLQVWRTDTDGEQYRIISSVAISDAIGDIISQNIYSLSSLNLTFQKGDMLGLYQPKERRSRLRSSLALYVQAGGASVNYYKEDDYPINNSPFTEILNDTNDFPLVHIITGLHTVDKLSSFVNLSLMYMSASGYSSCMHDN